MPALTLPLGKYSQAKVEALGLHWAKVVHARHPGTCFAAKAGLEPPPTEGPAEEESVDLEGLRGLKKHPSTGPEPEVPASIAAMQSLWSGR